MTVPSEASNTNKGGGGGAERPLGAAVGSGRWGARCCQATASPQRSCAPGRPRPSSCAEMGSEQVGAEGCLAAEGVVFYLFSL